jgi:hypothetical protein
MAAQNLRQRRGGLVETEMTPRWATVLDSSKSGSGQSRQPDEITPPCCICARRRVYVTGQVLTVDGGLCC